MARKRNPKRDEAFEIWQQSGGKISNRDIAKQLGENEKKIAVWKQRDKWNVVQQSENNVVQQKNKCYTTKPNSSRFQHGNKAAVGHGAPKRNKNAVKTGRYETIWLDCLAEKEQQLLEQVDTDEMVQIEQSIKALSIMEYRMFERLRRLIDGVTEKERRIVSECKEKGEIVMVIDDSGNNRMIYRNKPELVITEITETEYRKIDDILKQEKALLDVQSRKGRQIELKHKLQLEYEKLQLERKRVEIMARRVGEIADDNQSDNMDSYYEALKGQIGKVWADDN